MVLRRIRPAAPCVYADIWVGIYGLWSLRTFYTDLGHLIGYRQKPGALRHMNMACRDDPRNGESDR